MCVRQSLLGHRSRSGPVITVRKAKSFMIERYTLRNTIPDFYQRADKRFSVSLEIVKTFKVPRVKNVSGYDAYRLSNIAF